MSTEINQENPLETRHEFSTRHIGPSDFEAKEMLKFLGFSNLEEMAAKVIPQSIRSKHDYPELGHGLSEHATLTKLRGMMEKNKVFKSFIGLGYHDTITPAPILRHVFENPVWYTAYTPYQPEISQGRLEALLNFQTTVADLTGMEIANASLLDEGTAVAEAVTMAHGAPKNKATSFLASPNLHPHVLEVLRTRTEPLGLKMILGEPGDTIGDVALFAVVLSYPTTDGEIRDYSAAAQWAHDRGAMVVVDTDLLALTLLQPPGEWGADIVVGNSQRFGVPLGNGGPHAAFMATRDAYKRMLPGRLVGVSIDAEGKRALRLTLQTREQHIKRERATSNICTAQVLLANMAGMYAVYHGPQGLRRIAERVHLLAQILAQGLSKLGHKVRTENFFDTVRVETDQPLKLIQAGLDQNMNFRHLNDGAITISLDETTDLQTVENILISLNGGKKLPFTMSEVSVKLIPVQAYPAHLRRKSAYLTHPTFNSYHSETELLRYLHELQSKDLTLAHSMIPLGSCTMKLNATSELLPVSWPEVNRIHPFAPVSQMKGYLEMFEDLERKLSDITGFPGISLQPNAGSQGELAGLLVIRAYHRSRGEEGRNVCLIPSSSHGTNPASAVMAGMKVVVVDCDDQGNVDIGTLKAKAEEHRDQLAALMITYPSTHGVFEEGIVEICDIVHKNGGQVYMDGANLNALVGLCRPGEFGPDVCHMNLHKTFAIPHGGGGPGVGPIGVAEHLKLFLPRLSLVPESGPKTGITSTTSAPWGSASILPISWCYITMMGLDGLRKATLMAILNANYIAHRLTQYYPILYKGREGMVGHECILDLRGYKKSAGIDVNDVAKRLMDFGFHSPTMSWPVAGTLMVEPTESESKAELDRFIEAMMVIREEIGLIEKGDMPVEKSPLKNAPHPAHVLVKTEWNLPYKREAAAYPLPWVKKNKYWPPVSRVDNAYGDRNVFCSCPPWTVFKTDE